MRKLAAFALSFAAAVLLALYVMPEGGLVWAAGAGAAAGVIFALIFKDTKRLRAILISAGLIAGFLYSWGYGALFYSPAAEYDGKTELISVTAVDYAVPTAYGSRVDAKLDGIKIRLYLDPELVDISPGDELELTASLSLSNTQYGEEVDYFKSTGIYLLGYQQGEAKVSRAEELPLRYWFRALRKSLTEGLENVCPKDVLAFAKALTLGDKSDYYKDAALISAMDYSGIRHVIAVSGMHLSFLIGMVRLLTKRRRRTAFICIPVIFAFMALVGFPVSVVRAGVMQIFLLTAPLFRRENDPVTSLSAAMLLILLINPYAMMSASFQLSFGAMAGIILFSGGIYEGLNRWLKGKKWAKMPVIGGISKFVSATLSSTAGAMAFTVPLMAINFGYVSLVSPLTNLLTLWAVSAAFVLGVASAVLAVVWAPAGDVLAWCAAWPMRYIVSVAKALSKLPFAAVFTMSRYIKFYLVYVYIIFGVILLNRKKKKHIVLPVCLAVIALGLTLLLSSLSYTTADMTFTALDVGQGQSIVVTSGSLTAVIDCGGNDGNAGDAAADYLMSIGETNVDALILTHWHADHANGVEQLLERVNVERFIVPYDIDDEDDFAEELTEAASAEAEVIYATDVMTMTLGEVELTIYPPIGSGSENETGLVVLCSAGDYDALVTGDMDERIEKRLLERYSLPDIELLMVGHHGSKYSTCEELLDELRPETAFISVGRNSYGHPTEEALSRLEEAGVKVYRTDESGNVTVRVA